MFSLIKKLDEHSGTKAAPTRGQAARAVFWSFFGVRKRKHLDQDSAALTPAQVIVGGLVGAAIFVAVLIGVVSAVIK